MRANTVSIEKLMLLVPPGTPDPSAGIYNSTMNAMAALLVLALLANWRTHPVESFHYVENARRKS